MKNKYKDLDIDLLFSFKTSVILSIPIKVNPIKRITLQKYADIKQRCENPKNCNYVHYGKRGIKLKISPEKFEIWFIRELKKYYENHKTLRCSLSRKNNDGDYTLYNLEIDTVSNNTKELYSRRGNPTQTGTKLDEIACLVCYTYKDKRKLASSYEVSFQAISQIQRGVTRPYLHSVIHGVS